MAARQVALRKAKQAKDYVLYGMVVWHIRGDIEKPYRLTGWEFLREPMNLRVPKMVIMASAQCGKSEAFMIRAVADADWGRNVIYAFDVDDKAAQLVRERVNPNLEADPYLRSRCSDVDNVEQKKIGTGFGYFRGAQKESKAVSTSADTIILDEYDLMPKNTAALFEKRSKRSEDPTLIKISNPTFPEVGIHGEYLLSDRRKWHVPCKHCGDESPLEWATHVRADGQVICPKCGKDFDRLATGSWRTTNPDGQFPGYHIHSLLTPICDIKAVLQACNSADPFKRQAAVRMDKGEPYVDKTSGLDFEDIKQAAGSWKSKQFAPGGFMTVDPGSDFDVQVFEKFQTDGRFRCVWAGPVSGWGELRNLEARTGVIQGVIDAGPELDAAKQWCVARKGNWKRVTYTLYDAAGKLWSPDKDDDTYVHANRTGLADRLVAEIRSRNILYPLDDALNAASRLAKHLQAPKRVIERDKDGNFIARWLHDDSNPDHQFHCSMYALLVPLVLSAKSGRAISHQASGTY